MRKFLPLCVVFFVLLGFARAQAQTVFPFFSVNAREVTERQTGIFTVNWEFTAPGAVVPLHGSSDTWKEAPIFPRIPGSKIAFYFGLNPDEPAAIDQARWTNDQRTDPKQRPAMEYALGKGWCIEVWPCGTPTSVRSFQNPPLDRGMYRYWADLGIKNGTRHYGKLGPATLTKRLVTRWQEWQVIFGLYDPPPGMVLNDNIVLDMQKAKGARGLSFAPPRPLIAEVPVESRRPTRHDYDEDEDLKKCRSVILTIEGFSKIFFRLEPEGEKPTVVEVTDEDEYVVEMPAKCQSLRIYACESRTDRGVIVLNNSEDRPFQLRDGEPVRVSITRIKRNQ